MTLGAWAYIDDATYWAAPIETAYGGIGFSAPRLIKTKWEDSIEEITDQTGSTFNSRSKVYVLERLEENGYLVLGDQTAEDDPTSVDDAYEIKRVDRVRDLRGLHEEIICWL